MIFFLAFIFGSIIGSFVNVLIDRLPEGRSIVGGRSYCEHCKKDLSPFDLIPIFSYVLLQGKCRYCRTKIPQRILFVETLTGILFLAIPWYIMVNSFLWLSAISLAIIIAVSVAIIFIDIEEGIIPDALIVVFSLASVVLLVLTNEPFIPHILTGIGSFAFFMVLYLATKGKGMGFGDVKLSFAMGFLLGFPGIIIALYFAFLTGALVSVILIIWKKVKLKGGTIPFGPFLIGGSLFALFLGNILIAPLLSYYF